MAVYFYKLFNKIAELNITQKELMQRIGASSATLTKMRNNQTVSLDVIVRICDELKCDIGDIVTCIPQQTDVDITNKYNELNSIARRVLNKYIAENNIQISEIANITGLSLNTVKSFMSGNNITATSHSKLLRLGERYSQFLEETLKNELPQKANKRIYCMSCGKRKNGCWAIATIEKVEEKEFEYYCVFGFEQFYDENQKVFTTQDCPHPATKKEFEQASKKYMLIQKNDQHISVIKER